MASDSDANLYVCKLPPSFTNSQLDELFLKYGPIVQSRILRDKSGCSRCSGMVRLTSRQFADQAIAELNNGECLPGSSEPLTVRYAGQPSPQSTYISSTQNGSFGPIRNKTNPINRYNPISTAAQLSSGHGSYVGYNGSNGIMDNSNGSQWQGGAYSNQTSGYDTSNRFYNNSQNNYAMYTVGDGTTQSSSIPPPNQEMINQCFHPIQGWSLYVNNLKEDADELYIYKLFSPFGAITSINAMIDVETGKSKGFGFVNMPQYDAAYEAVRLLQGLMVTPGRALNVSFKVNKKAMKHQYAPCI